MTYTSLRPDRKRRPNPSSYYKPKAPRDAVISADKGLGQHFLVDPTIVSRIIDAAELTPESTVIEVGPGLGVLTSRLAAIAARVIAVEVDSRLVLRLQGTVANEHANLTVVQHDVLTITPTELLVLAIHAPLADGRNAAISPVGEAFRPPLGGAGGEPSSGEPKVLDGGSVASLGLNPQASHAVGRSPGVQPGVSAGSPSPTSERGLAGEVPYVVVANLPYNIGAAVLRHFLEAAQPPTHMVVMLQREVGDSICAAPGDLSLLGVSIQVYAQAESLFHVPPKAFEPPPKVTSSVIRLDVRNEPLVDAALRDAFFATVRAGFTAPRKQLPNTLAQGLHREVAEMRELILTTGIDPTLRPQALSIEDWKTLTTALESST